VGESSPTRTVCTVQYELSVQQSKSKIFPRIVLMWEFLDTFFINGEMEENCLVVTWTCSIACSSRVPGAKLLTIGSRSPGRQHIRTRRHLLESVASGL
jgi:hypothetical protein